jgi:uncharacterized protein with beta-barrel porin domain
MRNWRDGASRLAMGVVVTALFAPMTAEAQTFTVPSGSTVATGQSLSGTETGTVTAGGALVTTGTTVAVTLSGAATGVVVTNSGTIENTGTARAIDTGTNGTTTPRNYTITNNAGGIIRAQNDALRINSAVTGSTIVIDNAGLIQAGGTGYAQGQALDLRTIAATSGVSLTVNNRATGVIEALTDDALRPGQNAIINNAGIIRSFGANTSGGADGTSDGIDAGARTGIIVNNLSGGLISGARHGITADNDITVTNAAGGVILGRNGSGIGSDGGGTVTNYGRITGTYAGVGNIFNSSGIAQVNGDGDGVDLDNAGTILNYGIIEGTGAGGYDSGGRANASEGISIGGGTITNYGTISGSDNAIVVNKDTNLDRSGVAATTIVNHVGGSIIGQSGYAIRLENKTGTAIDNDTIVNYGTIIGNGTIPNPNAIVLMSGGAADPNSVGTLNGVTYTGTGSARFIRGDGSAIQMGEGNDVLTNYGTIIGNTGRAINLEGGNDTLNIMKGSRIAGLVDGGAGSDTLNYNKVGLSETNRVALQSGQTVNIGGTLYTSFEVVNANAPSFSALANANARGIAALFDNLPLNATGLGVVDMLDRVASATDVGAALSQLTPGSYQSLGRIGMNNAQQTTSLVGQHLTQNRINGLGTDVSGAGNALAMFDGGMFDRNFGTDRALAAVMAFPGSAGASLAEAGWGTGVVDAMAYAPINKAPALRPIAVTADHGFFVTSGASFAREGARADAPGFKANTVNVLAGYDQRLSDNFVAGVFGGYAFTRGELDSNGSNSRISTGTIGGYGTYQAPTWFATLMGLYGFSDYTTSRVALGSANDATFSGDHYAIRGTLGTDIRVSGWVVTPEIGLQYMRVMTDGFTERGSAAALIVGADSSESLRSSVGARFAYDYAISGGVVTPELRFAWLHEFSDGIRGINASFADTTLPGSFVTSTASGIRDRGVLGAGLSGKLAPLTVLSVNYDAIVGGSDTVTHQVMGRIKHAF